MATRRSPAKQRDTGRVRTGMGGWTYVPWRGLFYPDDLVQKRELAYASRQVSTIEINGTYYRSPAIDIYRRWADETPEGFVFSVKAPRHIVQSRTLAGTGERIGRFLDGAVGLGDRLGPVLWQFLPTRRFDPDDMAAFLDLLPERHGGLALRHAVEVRHDSFMDPDWLALARQRSVATVFTDSPDHPSFADITGPFIYARLMRSRAKETNGYPARDMKTWATHANAWQAGKDPVDLPHVGATLASGAPRDVFVYFISAAKERNPAAAVALGKRVEDA